ncbi:Cytochrome c, mono-and diheme variants [Meinhardsimonia xiamenensis]|jgi:mono/diheme cytochrome c family protein|uniref:Cytochrome c, mono-and diheme variants n=1 Tax=Meinhardsimonia xiamenensis TaxID=990712 RepID=A0A1G9BD87_9RHOB|nr:cytochrome c [Meinhardsimonia xiamenensis]PRX35035.1 mono/diheme cytochrome c family protein [Meinhardsimonia xiamenensis]SDK37034.1 Cytochrome c, mono-and diheme variants [Meinhardsimonia xiamenensis]
MRRLARALAILAVTGVAAFWYLTAPRSEPVENLTGLAGDAGRGALVFAAGGCASCHAAPGAEGAARLELGGGRRFASPFGTFVAPNISPDPEHGIGGWSVADLVNAMHHGTSPEGAHYYPAFPYTSYARVSLQDIADLHAYLLTLPPVARPSAPHEVGFPFNIRRLLGGWKLLFARHDGPVVKDVPPEAERGRYLVEGLGHCGECHTPRNALGGLDYSRWLGGAPNPTGKGRIPNITPAALDWSEADIAYYLETGFTPDFDSAGGEMAEVVKNTAQLSPEDRASIAAYLKAVPPVRDAAQ